MKSTESYTYSEEQIDYWARVHDHLGLGRHGIPLDFFLADPFLHLRRIGTGGWPERDCPCWTFTQRPARPADGAVLHNTSGDKPPGG